MCPLWPFHLFLIYAIILGPLWMLSTTVVAHVITNTQWGIEFDPSKLKMQLGDVQTVKFSATGLTPSEKQNGIVYVVAENEGTIANVSPEGKTYLLSQESGFVDGNWTSAFNITGNFLGKTYVKLKLENGDSIKESNSLPISVVRPQRVIDSLFLYSVIILVSIIYINFGCALDWSVFKMTIRRPVGPLIGFICQFLLMPVLSYGLGKLLFPQSVPMQLGMFFTGVSPAGGASNIWTYILGGNLNLSITMTTISTFAAFAMMPLWIFTLGRVIFAEGELAVPYSRIASFAFGLIIPLAIGFIIQKYLPRLCKIMVRILKPFSTILILFIIIFAIITNMYLFKLFTWQIVIAGLGLPWLGYLGGTIMARLCKQAPDDTLAISIETGIQNTGIAIFLLQVSLGQPEADLTTVVPVAVAIMTPFPLLALFIYYRCSARWSKSKAQVLNPEEEERITSPSSNGTTEPFSIHVGNIKLSQENEKAFWWAKGSEGLRISDLEESALLLDYDS